MSKVLTIRIDDSTYKILKKAAESEKRALSNYIEYAALNFTLNDMFISDKEMAEIEPFMNDIKTGLDEAKKGKYKIVG